MGGGGEVPRIHQALKEPLKEASKEGLKKVLSIRGLDLRWDQLALGFRG